MYNGDFSSWRDASGNLIPIYDPATTRPNPNGTGFIRDAFPNNQIPRERFSHISQEVIKLATMRPDLGGVRNNFAYTPGDQINTNPWNKFSIKLDHNLSRKDRRSSVSPPPCAYLMRSAYRRDHEASAPTTPRFEGQ